MTAAIAPEHRGQPGQRIWTLTHPTHLPHDWPAILRSVGLDLIHVGRADDFPARTPVDAAGSDETTERVFEADTAPPRPRPCWHDIDDDGLILIWHPTSFEGARQQLEQIGPPHLRARAVVCAPGLPPPGFADAIRQLGGLTWWRAPWNPWLITLAHRALERRPGTGLWVPPVTLEQLQRDAQRRPLQFLTALAETAREALHAHHAEILHVRDHASSTARLVRRDGEVVLVPVSPSEADTLPGHLAHRALEWRQAVVVPDITHAERFHGGPWVAAISLPIVTPTAQPQVGKVLQVYWKHAFLPTPAELQLLRTLVTAAAVHETRLHERNLIQHAHTLSLLTLSEVPWTSTDTGTDSATTEADLVVRFAHRVLQARSLLPGLTKFYARLSTNSRSQADWIQVDTHAHARLDATDRAALEQLHQDCQAHPDTPIPSTTGHWARSLQLMAGSNKHTSGDLLAIFEDRGTAIDGFLAFNRLAADLQMALRLLRRSNDSAAMKELARQLADATDPRIILDNMAGLITRQLDADGVKVYILADAPQGAHIEQIYRTGQAMERSRTVHLDPNRGLADWVIRHNDWLRIEHPDTARALEPTAATTGRHGSVAIAPRSVRELWEGALPDSEKTQVIIPLHHSDQVAGALGVWRTTPHPFDPDLDVETLLGFAPHVASACARAKSMETADREFTAIRKMARELQPETPLHTLERNILATAGALSSAHMALMFRHDASQPGVLAAVRAWCSDAIAPHLAERFLRNTAAWGADASTWKASCRALVEATHTGAPPLQLHQFVRLPADESGHPVGAVALVMLRDQPAPVPLLAETSIRHSTESLLQYGGLMLGSHVRVHAAALVDRLAKESTEPSRSALDRAAERLQQTIHGSVVLLTEGQGPTQTITAVHPTQCTLSQEATSGTAALRTKPGDALRIPSIADANRVARMPVDPDLLAEVCRTSGWTAARSWMCVPVRHEERLLGTLQIFTPQAGTVLLPEHESLTTSLSQWAAKETAKADRRHTLEQLNTIGRDLAGRLPDVLTRELPPRLQAWARHAIRRACQVAVVARSGARYPILSACTAGITDHELQQLRTMSLHMAGRDHTWARRAHLPGLPDSKFSRRLAGTASALKLSSDSRLEGHIFVMHPNAFTPSDREILDAAAREMSILLHGEAVRQEWKLEAGLFRHALLGPVQGLQSAAQLLALLSQQANPPLAQLEKARNKVQTETATIRMWREIQRLFPALQEGAKPDIRARKTALKPLVEGCIARYEAAMTRRGIQTRLVWHPAGPLIFPFDERMLDLVLSNLLDNAQKYAFYNRDVTVEVKTDATHVELVVEDIGTGIASTQGDLIYLPGIRARGRDPIRAIAGEGLGLFLARTLCEAMDGSLHHTSEPAGVVTGDKQPHRVRFTVRLPHHWNRK